MTTLRLDINLARLWVAASDLSRDLRSVRLADSGVGSPEPGAHTHTVPTLAVCLAGVVRVRLTGRSVDLQAAEALLVPPGAPHTHEPLRAGAATLSQGFLIDRSDVSLAIPGQEWQMVIPAQPARTCLDEACLATTPPARRLILVKEALAGLGQDGGQPLQPMPDAVNRMWRFLRRNRLSPITVADILRSSGLAPTRAHLVFRSYFGETPLHILMRYRIEYARHLLLAGERVSAVAATCGFRSRRHFTSAFRQVHAQSPRQWLAASGGPSRRAT